MTISGQGEYRYRCNQYSTATTTTAAISSTDTTIPLASVTNLASFGSINIDHEMIYYNGISGTSLQNVIRGKNGTIANAHLSGSSATQVQAIMTVEGAVPSLSNPNAKSTLYESIFFSDSGYFAAGTNGSNGVILSYNGDIWSTAFTGPSSFSFYDIEVGSTYGQAVGYNSAATASSIYQYNGISWSLLSSGLSFLLNAVGCDNPYNATLCWGAGSALSPARGLFYSKGISYLVSSSTPNFLVMSLGCNSGTCAAVGKNHAFNFPSNSTSPTSISNQTDFNSPLPDFQYSSCATTNSCLAVDAKGSIYYYNGSWAGPYSISTSSKPLTAVHCPISNFCVLVGYSGVIFNCNLPIVSASSCSAQSSPGTLNLRAVHCNAVNDCLAVGSGTVAYRYLGGSWTAITLPASYTLNALSGAIGMGSVGTLTPTTLLNH